MQLCFSFHAYQLSVSPVVQNDVLGFQVSVDDPSGVQERQSLDDAAGVEAGGAVVKRAPERQRQEGRSKDPLGRRAAGGERTLKSVERTCLAGGSTALPPGRLPSACRGTWSL